MAGRASSSPTLCGLPDSTVCTEVFNVRAQPFCTEIGRFASLAKCWMFDSNLEFLPNDAEFNKEFSATYVGGIWEHNISPDSMDGSVRQACMKGVARCSTSKHLDC